MKCHTCDETKECSAILYAHSGTYYILGQYGSRFDMQRYALKRGQYATGNICDDCTEKYINEGKAQLIEDGVW
jgi:hypothetical protein